MPMTEILRPGWTQRVDKYRLIFHAGIRRYNLVFPGMEEHNPVSVPGDHYMRYVLLTAGEVLAIDDTVRGDNRVFGHNFGPSYESCKALAGKYPCMLFGGYLFGEKRGPQEGFDLDSVYVPLPDPNEVMYREILKLQTADEKGRVYGPDEDDVVTYGKHTYRRLWWD